MIQQLVEGCHIATMYATAPRLVLQELRKLPFIEVSDCQTASIQPGAELGHQLDFLFPGDSRVPFSR